VTDIAVIGAGIKGATVAALLSKSSATSVTLIEAGDGASGATVTNHGRLHLGTAGFTTDSVELMAHRQKGSELWRMMGVGASSPPAVYLFDDEATFDLFAEKSRAAGIATRVAEHLPPAWTDAPVHAVEVLEYGFSPAAVANLLRRNAEANGATWLPRTAVLDVDADARGPSLRTTAGDLRFDVVVNCAARWSSQIPMLWRAAPLLVQDWFIWQIMVAPRAQLPLLDRVLVRARANGAHASVVPHGDFVTLDFKSSAEPEETAPAPGPTPRLRPVQRGDRYLETCIDAFAPLADAADIKSFEGIQGRIRGAAPGSVNTLFSDPAVPGYLLAQGGQASTALLDSLDVARHLWTKGYLSDDPLVALGRLARGDVNVPEISPSLMAWEVGDA
jgi:glycine/D-amino acid oxidase-like deaminating enzyme